MTNVHQFIVLYFVSQMPKSQKVAVVAVVGVRRLFSTYGRNRRRI